MPALSTRRNVASCPRPGRSRAGAWPADRGTGPSPPRCRWSRRGDRIAEGHHRARPAAPSRRRDPSRCGFRASGAAPGRRGVADRVAVSSRRCCGCCMCTVATGVGAIDEGARQRRLAGLDQQVGARRSRRSAPGAIVTLSRPPKRSKPQRAPATPRRRRCCAPRSRPRRTAGPCRSGWRKRTRMRSPPASVCSCWRSVWTAVHGAAGRARRRHVG